VRGVVQAFLRSLLAPLCQTIVVDKIMKADGMGRTLFLLVNRRVVSLFQLLEGGRAFRHFPMMGRYNICSDVIETAHEYDGI
jgi:hypothetical protein